MIESIQQRLAEFGQLSPYAEHAVRILPGALLVLVLSVLANLVAKRIILRIVKKVVGKTKKLGTAVFAHLKITPKPLNVPCAMFEKAPQLENQDLIQM